MHVKFISFYLFTTRYNRQTDPVLEDSIDEIWEERLSKAPWIFNGAKFRLHSYFLASQKNFSDSEGFGACEQTTDAWMESKVNQKGDFVPTLPTNECSEKRGTALTSKPEKQGEYILLLRLGLTSYKDYLGTNWSEHAQELCRRGEVEFGDTFSFLAQPLGVGAVLCTIDENIVLIRRSQKVAEAGGLLDIPGGHPEPKVKRAQRYEPLVSFPFYFCNLCSSDCV